MKKRYLKIIVAVILLLALSATLVGCDTLSNLFNSNKLSDAEKEVVGKYELIEISIQGYPQITVNTYDYFTLEFKSDRKCVVRSKAGINEYEAEAEWKINSDGEIEIITKVGYAKAVEKYRYVSGVIVGTNSTPLNGSVVDMTTKFQKID